MQQSSAGLTASLDDEEKVGIALNSHARASLMAKLARTEDLVTSTSTSSKIASEVEKPVTSRCVWLKNMFDPNEFSLT